MSLEMEDYQKSLEALQTKLSDKEKALQDSQEEVSRTEKRAEDFKAQIGKKRNWLTSVNIYMKKITYVNYGSIEQIRTWAGFEPMLFSTPVVNALPLLMTCLSLLKRSMA